ncbi:XRE family transcriptional regulator [Streptococcus agalactiae]|uniref:XRE family transcriptional regulator n=1 Tax=Streptococcus agalactiae TaxID=1311 RepID=A0A837KWN5_STRAG|nr:XRE family transcriptional regulator [Streptococcus agalactiae]KLL35916.1 XRE family transcriptional regulator [Streptococcus agalactiae]
MHIGRYIKKYRDTNNLSMAEFAKESGISKAYVSVLEKNRDPRNGKEIIPSIPIIKKVSDTIGISFDDLLNSLDENQIIALNETKTEKNLNSSTLQKITFTSSQLEHSRQLIVLDTAETQLEQQNTVEDSKNTVVELFSYNYYDHAASAGTGQYLNDVQVETIELPVDYDADFVIPVYGDSMEPDYHSGDYVFVKLSVELTDGDIGVFEYYGDAYIKQLLIHAEGAFLHSLNSKYEDIPIDRDSDFRIIGKVVGNFMPKEH